MSRPTIPVTYDRLVAFLNALHGPDAAGVIEVRLIEDKPHGAPVARRWFELPEEAVLALPELLVLADERGAAIYFGVLRRRQKGAGKSADCIAGAAVWADVDFKDFGDGEEEVRKRLDAFPIRPSVVVRSGRGFHAYWTLREPAEPSELSALSKAVARDVGGDHTHDAARILRLPGSYHRKNPATPILVEFEVFEPERQFNVSELRDALEMVGTKPLLEPVAPASQMADDYQEPPAPRMPPMILALIHSKRRVAALFNGRGKPELDAEGKELDRSSSGYDFSFARALIKAGAKDPEQLGAALANRPDGAARAKGAAYIARTVRKALETHETFQASAPHACQVDFVPNRVRLFDSNPARYEFEIDGVTFVVASRELRSSRSFSIAVMDALHRLPLLPSDEAEWRALVNHWLESAEVVEQPPDASFEPRLIEAVQRAVADLPVGDAAEDLDSGKAVTLTGGALGFKTQAILRCLRDDMPTIGAADVSRVLQGQGYVSGTASLNGTKFRVWRRTDGHS
jgi:hypothetical protein